MRGLAIIFSEVDDPRAENARHDLSEILFIALAAVICGAQGCADMALFGRSKESIVKNADQTLAWAKCDCAGAASAASNWRKKPLSHLSSREKL